MDSSLIFLAVIGIWLVYFVPRWVARREQAAAARPARDSRNMRVLDRPTSGATARSATRGYLLNGSYEETRSPQPQRVPTHTTPSRTGSPVVRCILFLVFATAVVLTPGAVLFAQRGQVPWAFPITCILVGFVAFAALRARARALKAAPGRAARTARTVASDPATAEPVGAPSAEPTAPAEAAPARSRADEVFDEDAHRRGEQAAERAAEQTRAETLRRRREAARASMQPGEWVPNEVPLPTYLLKPTAPTRRVVRRRPQPEQVDIRDQRPEDRVIDLVALEERTRRLRRASGD